MNGEDKSYTIVKINDIVEARFKQTKSKQRII